MSHNGQTVQNPGVSVCTRHCEEPLEGIYKVSCKFLVTLLGVNIFRYIFLKFTSCPPIQLRMAQGPSVKALFQCKPTYNQ